MADADPPDRRDEPQGDAGLLLRRARLLRRQSRIRDDGRFRPLRVDGARAGAESAARLGGQPHGARRAVGDRASGRLVRARRGGRAGRAQRLGRHGQAQLRQPSRVAGADRRHALLARGARRGRVPLRYGHAGAHGLLAGGCGAAARSEAQSLHAGRSRAGGSFRPCVRRLLCVGVPPYRQRHRAGTPPRVGPAQLPLRRPRPLSAFGHAADVHLQSRREFVERQRVPPAGRCGRNHGRADVRAAAVDAARLYGAGVRLRPFVRLLRPRSDGRSPSGALHGAVPAAVSVEAPQPRVAGGRAGRFVRRDREQRQGLPDDFRARGGGQPRTLRDEPLALYDPRRFQYGHLSGRIRRCADGRPDRRALSRRAGYGAVELPDSDSGVIRSGACRASVRVLRRALEPLGEGLAVRKI